MVVDFLINRQSTEVLPRWSIITEVLLEEVMSGLPQPVEQVILQMYRFQIQVLLPPLIWVLPLRNVQGI